MLTNNINTNTVSIVSMTPELKASVTKDLERTTAEIKEWDAEQLYAEQLYANTLSSGIVNNTQNESSKESSKELNYVGEK